MKLKVLPPGTGQMPTPSTAQWQLERKSCEGWQRNVTFWVRKPKEHSLRVLVMREISLSFCVRGLSLGRLKLEVRMWCWVWVITLFFFFFNIYIWGLHGYLGTDLQETTTATCFLGAGTIWGTPNFTQTGKLLYYIRDIAEHWGSHTTSALLFYKPFALQSLIYDLCRNPYLNINLASNHAALACL